MSRKGTLEIGRFPSRSTHPEASNVVQDEDHHQRNRSPPPYSSPSVPPVATPPSFQIFPGLPKLNYALYSPPSFKLSADETTITSYSPEFSRDPTSLYSLIQYQATIPPKAQISVRGWGSSGYFDIRLNMMSQLVNDGDQKMGLNYLKVVEDGELAYRGDVRESTRPTVHGGIDEWVQQYCADRSEMKQFTIQRTVPNWDTEYIEGRLRALVASTGSPHPVTIGFSLTHSTVVVRSPNKTNNLFTSLKRSLGGARKYEVVKIVWPYASLPPGESGRRFAVQSEESWWNDWKDAIRHAVVNARHGWVTSEDRLEFIMAPEKDQAKVKNHELSNSG